MPLRKFSLLGSTRNTCRISSCQTLSRQHQTSMRCRNAKFLLLTVPMQQMRGFLVRNKPKLQSSILVACSKGIEVETGLGPLGVIQDVLGDVPAALLTGPSFAHDIAVGLPTALTLACSDSVQGGNLQETLSRPALRVYRTTDVIGASLGGALKNVMAIACGVCDGAGLGDSARAASFDPWICRNAAYCPASRGGPRNATRAVRFG
ncbi:Glycerol-3-phosphate dehydrogenase [NAD(P)+] [Nymphon striatum]|nr:Glycerol-3-phosphate dehydrogenase [NAD(P)+] [Nymphon striatum]